MGFTEAFKVAAKLKFEKELFRVFEDAYKSKVARELQEIYKAAGWLGKDIFHNPGGFPKNPGSLNTESLANKYDRCKKQVLEKCIKPIRDLIRKNQTTPGLDAKTHREITQAVRKRVFEAMKDIQKWLNDKSSGSVPGKNIQDCEVYNRMRFFEEIMEMIDEMLNDSFKDIFNKDQEEVEPVSLGHSIWEMIWGMKSDFEKNFNKEFKEYQVATGTGQGHCNGYNHPPDCQCGWGGPKEPVDIG